MFKLQTVQIAVAANQSGRHQLIDQLFAQPFDVHGVAGRREPDSLPDLRRALRIRTADVDASFVLHDWRLALGANRGKRKLGELRRSQVFDPHDVRNDLARLLHDDNVPDPDVLADDFVGVVQTGPADDRSRELHRLQFRNRRDRARFAHLHVNRQQFGGRLVLFKLVGHDPSRALGTGPQPLALVESIDLEDEPVHFKRQSVQLGHQLFT